MNVVGKVGSLISQSVYTIVTPFHPFGGAVDVIVVQQQDGTFRSTPWYVRFGKFQGVLKGGEQIVRISVNGIEANFHMYLDNSGEAYFAKEVDDEKVDTDDNTGMEMANAHRFTHSVSDAAVLALKRDEDSFDAPRIQRTESDSGRRYFDFQDDRSSFEGSVDLSEYESNPYDTLDGDNYVDSQDSHPEMVLFSGDGQVLTAPISESENNTDTMQLETPKFHLGPGEGGEFIPGESALATDYISQTDASVADVPTNSHCHTNSVVHISEVQMESHQEEDGQVIHQVKETLRVESQDESCNIQNDSVEGRSGMTRHGVFKSCLELQEFPEMSGNDDLLDKDGSSEDQHSAEDTCAIRPVVENEEGSIAQSRYDDGFSPSDTSVSSVDSRSSEPRPQDVEKKVSGEVKTDSGRHSVIDVAISNDEHTGKSASTEELDDIQQTLVPEDHSDKSEVVEPQIAASSKEAQSHPGFEVSLCGHELKAGIGLVEAAKAFEAHRISADEFKVSAPSIIKNENLIIKINDRYLPWEKAASHVLGKAVFGLDLPVESKDTIPVEQDDVLKSRDDDPGSAGSGRKWRLWPPFRKVKTLEHTNSNSSNEDVFVDSESALQNSLGESSPSAGSNRSPRKQSVRTNLPTNDQIASLNLNEGQNRITFTFSTRVLGKQQVDAHIFLWKWNARIVISDVDGTITKSDVLGQFMPLVGKDWTQSGVARLFSAIKENGYQVLFLSARAIVQAYITRNFLLNVKQDGKTLPNGPVVISPDGLFPSLYREVVRRTPHEFKIACLEDIRNLFPSDYNPFYAGFGNRDTDELSYMKIGIPKGKIFIINPKGEVANSHRMDVKSYTSLHTLVNDMFPSTSLLEQEDYNSWNYWRVPLPDIDD